MTYTVRHIGTVTVQAESEAALEAMLLSYWTPQSVAARLAALEVAVRHAHDTLWELNPSNYDHDEVCRVNEASVEVILSLAPLLGETHGKTPEWWAARAPRPPREFVTDEVE